MKINIFINILTTSGQKVQSWIGSVPKKEMIEDVIKSFEKQVITLPWQDVREWSFSLNQECPTLFGRN